MIGYKVVYTNTHTKEFESAVIKTRSVRYAIGKKTEPLPDSGPLCAFASREDAEMFKAIMHCQGNIFRIFEVDYKPSASRHVWITRPKLPVPGKPTEYEKVLYPLSDMRTGTVLADSVELLRDVTEGL